MCANQQMEQSKCAFQPAGSACVIADRDKKFEELEKVDGIGWGQDFENAFRRLYPEDWEAYVLAAETRGLHFGVIGKWVDDKPTWLNVEPSGSSLLHAQYCDFLHNGGAGGF
ncbi:hypothetical protein [Pseudomonas abietaniphila]|uniref:Uncharacterized protein n=1 Tax=Pseudomonas abietaniphila TaxID=89065 RepID=A0A1G8RQE1_9PSED|nr:hypothetical protein [Pseudomonas abietaniphila]SDJ19178.1 hypothetical protein SAMN05216605_12321 [Pseudomonas abietaniphila]